MITKEKIYKFEFFLVFMDLKEIMDYAEIGMRNFLLFEAGVILAHKLSGGIKSQEDLDRMILEETQVLGMDASEIVGNYPARVTQVWKDGDKYRLDISTDFISSNRAGVRHELYHVFKGDVDRYTNFPCLDYFLKQEPRAILYGAFKLKL